MSLPFRGVWTLSPTRLGDCAGLAPADTLRSGMQYDRRVIGYHACSKEVANRLLLEGEGFKHSTNAWEWLGHGIYFWEFGLQRAYDWAQERWGSQGREFAVVGALIQLGNCLDLLDTDHTRRLAEVASFMQATGDGLPQNRDKRRDLDCFLVNNFCDEMQQEGGFDTVRGLFQEGCPIADGSEILDQNHIQIVVRRREAIIGLFRPSSARNDGPAEPAQLAQGATDGHD